MLDIVRLRALAAIAAHGSVTKAAKHLKYSQPAVSHRLARLEAETGARLVQRVGRGIRLTPEGEHLARRAAEIVGRVDTAAAELSAMVGLRAGRVRVAGFQSVLATLVPHAAATLRRDHPGIELHLADAHPQVALDLLRAGQVDAAVIFRYDDTTPDGVRTTHLFDDPMHLLSLEPGQTLRDHRDSAWIAGCEHCRHEFVDACQQAGFTPHIAYTSDDVIVDQARVAPSSRPGSPGSPASRRVAAETRRGVLHKVGARGITRWSRWRRVAGDKRGLRSMSHRPRRPCGVIPPLVAATPNPAIGPVTC